MDDSALRIGQDAQALPFGGLAKPSDQLFGEYGHRPPMTGKNGVGAVDATRLIQCNNGSQDQRIKVADAVGLCQHLHADQITCFV
ncbi:hypothetical protein RND64_00190 [Gordonia sp. w5E2]|uniref:Uncharacterized protein n=1 Tax=Gordonia jacobaea TaxID=122202 RepID=A0ABR5IBB9_9ACTN|nr:hypothetical protein [Gordonia jacobaea]KNA90992.1 hypothetical protein ABW18_11770 [Gordonia jacobaea]